MPMPKGFKSKNGYATVTEFEGGAAYRSTARNVFLGALRKIARPVHQLHGLSDKQDILQATAKDPRLQSGVAEILESIRRSK